jgi:hypothetical protein
MTDHRPPAPRLTRRCRTKVRQRLPVVLITAVALWVLLHGSITIPVLSLIGLIAWALFASALAVGYARHAAQLDRQLAAAPTRISE